FSDPSLLVVLSAAPGEEAFTVRTEGYARQRRMCLEGTDFLTRIGVPYLHHPHRAGGEGVGPGEDAFAVGAERRACYKARVPRSEDRLALFCIPPAGRVVVAGEDAFAVGAERHARYRAKFVPKGEDHLALFRVPHLDH